MPLRTIFISTSGDAIPCVLSGYPYLTLRQFKSTSTSKTLQQLNLTVIFKRNIEIITKQITSDTLTLDGSNLRFCTCFKEQ